MKKLWKRISNRNKLSYFMNIAFGLSLLMITLQFQFGDTKITLQGETTEEYILPDLTISLGYGYITEANQAVRIAEGLLSFGLIVLGIERLKNGKKRTDSN